MQIVASTYQLKGGCKLILKRSYLAFAIGTLALCYGFSGTLLAQEDRQFLQANSEAAGYRNLMNQYCVTCHNTQLKTAGLMLDQAGLDAIEEVGEIWEKVVRKPARSASDGEWE